MDSSCRGSQHRSARGASSLISAQAHQPAVRIAREYAGLLGIGALREGQTSTDNMLNVLNSMLGIEDSWPPYYSTVINGDLHDNANSTFQVLKVGMRVASISPSGPISLDHIQYSKESKIFGSYKKEVTAPPEIQCAR